MAFLRLFQIVSRILHVHPFVSMDEVGTPFFGWYDTVSFITLIPFGIAVAVSTTLGIASAGITFICECHRDAVSCLVYDN